MGMILQFVLLGLFQLVCPQTTTYIGDGYCDDDTEACEAYSWLWRDYTKDVVCCTEDEFCDSDYGCEDLPLEMRYRESGPDWNFISCCELIVTTTPAPTTTTSFVSYYEGDGNCTEEIEACEEKRNWRGKIIKEADVACCSLDWLCSEQGYIGDFSLTCNDLPFNMADILLEKLSIDKITEYCTCKIPYTLTGLLRSLFVTVISKFLLIFTKSEINFELSMTVYDECCNRPLPTEPETTSTTTTTTEPTTEIVTTISLTTAGATNSNETSYVGDGYCDDSYEACQEERNFWGSITSEQDLACCDEDEVCGTDGLIPQNLIGCEDLPLDFRYEHINSTFFYFCCELTTTSAPEPTRGPLQPIVIITQFLQSLQNLFSWFRF